jgi:hypothetical protein
VQSPFLLELGQPLQNAIATTRWDLNSAGMDVYDVEE